MHANLSEEFKGIKEVLSHIHNLNILASHERPDYSIKNRGYIRPINIRMDKLIFRLKRGAGHE